MTMKPKHAIIPAVLVILATAAAIVLAHPCTSPVKPEPEPKAAP